MSITLKLDQTSSSSLLSSKIADKPISKYINTGDMIQAIAHITNREDRLLVVQSFHLTTLSITRVDRKYESLIKQQLGYLWSYALSGRSTDDTRIVDWVRGHDRFGRLINNINVVGVWNLKRLVECYEQCYLEGLNYMFNSNLYAEIDLVPCLEFVATHYDHWPYWERVYQQRPNLIYWLNLFSNTTSSKRILKGTITSALTIHVRDNGAVELDDLVVQLSGIVDVPQDATHMTTDVKIVGDNYYFEVDGQRYVNGILLDDDYTEKEISEHPYTIIYKQLVQIGLIYNLDAHVHPSLLGLIWYGSHLKALHVFISRYKIKIPVSDVSSLASVYLNENLDIDMHPPLVPFSNTIPCIMQDDVLYMGVIALYVIDDTRVMIGGIIYPNAGVIVVNNNGIYNQPYRLTISMEKMECKIEG